MITSNEYVYMLKWFFVTFQQENGNMRKISADHDVCVESVKINVSHFN